MRSNLCENCYNVFYDYFCGYQARNCKIHGCIDCNPDSYVKLVLDKKDIECPDFITPKDFKEKEKTEYKQRIKNKNNIDIKSINTLIETLGKEYFINADL